MVCIFWESFPPTFHATLPLNTDATPKYQIMELLLALSELWSVVCGSTVPGIGADMYVVPVHTGILKTTTTSIVLPQQRTVLTTRGRPDPIQ